MPLRIALTGGIGSGKTTVAKMFQQLGAPVIDTDIIARDIVKPGTECLDKIVHDFGEVILNPDGTLNRAKLREVAFSDKTSREKVESILHPVIFAELEQKLTLIDYPYCIIVIPLLLETDSMNRFDRILVVDVPERTQLERTISRDKCSAQIVEDIIKSQATRKQRLKFADDIIDNSVKIEELSHNIQSLHEKFLKLGIG